MVHYKLSYFGIRFIGEIPRQIFAFAGQEFEDERVPKPDWAAKKPTTPYGSLPVLYVDGKPLAQSHAICRYLAREFGINGKGHWEEAQVNALADQFKDYLDGMRPFNQVKLGLIEGDEKKIYKEVFLPNFKRNYLIFNNLLKANPSGFLIGDSLTWVDILIAQHTWELLADSGSVFSGSATLFNKFPEIKAHQQKIHAIPNIKKWIKNRPVNPA